MFGGGAQRVMLNLAIGLQERGLRVDMLLAEAEGPYLREIPPEIQVVNFATSRVLTALPGLVRYLRTQQPVGLISAMSHTNIIAIWAKILAGVDTKVVVTVHNAVSLALSNDRTTKFKQRIARKIVLLLTRAFYGRAHAVVAVSKGVADDIVKLKSIDRSQIEVIYNPAITPQLESKSKENVKHKWLAVKDRPVFISVGRMTDQKDFWNLLRAFKLVLQERPARLIILGEGVERDSLEKLVVELGIEAEVDMPGFIDNPHNYVANADVFVVSSAWEGFSLVLAEALAVGVAAVSTDCLSGPREILQDGRLGRLVPVGDSKMLAEAMIATLDDPLETVTPEDLKHFTRDASVDAYLRLLRK